MIERRTYKFKDIRWLSIYTVDIISYKKSYILKRDEFLNLIVKHLCIYRLSRVWKNLHIYRLEEAEYLRTKVVMNLLNIYLLVSRIFIRFIEFWTIYYSFKIDFLTI